MKHYVSPGAGLALAMMSCACQPIVIDAVETSSQGSGGDIPISSSSGGGSAGAGGTTATTATTGTGGTGGMSGAATTSTGSGGGPGPTVLVALLDSTDGQDGKLTVVDPANPNPPLLDLPGIAVEVEIGMWRRIGTSRSKRRLGVIDATSLRVFDENLQPLVNVASSKGYGHAIYPTEQAIFALSGPTLAKFDANGSFVGSTSETGVDLVVDEEHQVVWTTGQFLLRAKTDLTDVQSLHHFGWYAVSLDLDGNGGIWVAEGKNQDKGSNQLVHFDVNGNIISGDTLPLDARPCSVRVDRNSGLVWVAMGTVAYRDVDGQLKKVPGLTGKWAAVEPDPLDSSRAWVSDLGSEQVVHVDTNGTIIESLEGFNSGRKWLAAILQGP